MLNRRLISADQEAVVRAGVQRVLYRSHQGIVLVSDRLQRHLTESFYLFRFLSVAGSFALRMS